ncbi:hypothetical protein QAD02_003129 [Eretmocerus hayati]|uniref:Uncharacterized protein n=1 Tax=Eretmocerus hayati TaxID=131215 RepID=A0ACC2NL14_9HYME|nr:hypothetical protein QAD02_003129 [Eretmocerus hayati]
MSGAVPSSTHENSSELSSIDITSDKNPSAHCAEDKAAGVLTLDDSKAIEAIGKVQGIITHEITHEVNVLARSSPDSPSNINVTYDIGDYIGHKIDDYMMMNLLLHPWVPPRNYQFPYSEHRKNDAIEKRYASHAHLESCNWLVFSESKQGYFCKFCPWFVNAGLAGYRRNVPTKIS